MSFNYKSTDSVNGMTLTELRNYKSEIVAHAKSEGISQEELFKAHRTNVEVSEILLSKSLSEKADVEAIKGLKADIEAIKSQQIKSLEGTVKTQGAVIKQLQDNEGSTQSRDEVVSFKGLIKKALKDNEEKIKSLAGGEKIEINLLDSMSLKAVAPITGGNIIGSNVGAEPNPQRLGVINTPQTRVFITEIIDSDKTSRSAIEWIDEKNQEGDVTFVEEGAIKPQLDMDFEPKISSAKKIAGFIKVGEESLTDFDWLAGEIEKKLKRRHDIAKEKGILFGDSANAGEFDGITKNASGFVGGSLAGTMSAPNSFDVIRVAIAQIYNTGSGEFVPDYVIVNPDDAGAMDLERGSDGHYVYPPFVVNTPSGVQMISGIKVLEKPQMSAGSFLVGDFQKSHERELEGFNIRIGWTDDDFKRNMRSIIGESRCHHFISSVENNAFIFDTFANAKTVLMP